VAQWDTFCFKCQVASLTISAPSLQWLMTEPDIPVVTAPCLYCASIQFGSRPVHRTSSLIIFIFFSLSFQSNTGVVLSYVHSLLGNGLVNKFTQRRILGKQSLLGYATILTTEEMFSLWSASCSVLSNRTVDERPRGRSSSPGKGKNIFPSTSSRPVLALT
jgi:hypothetical protein